MKKLTVLLTVLALLPQTTACRVGEQRSSDKLAQAGYITRGEIREIVERKFGENQIRPDWNVSFQRGSVSFRCDGYDYNLHIGWVYLNPMDAARGEPDVTPAEVAALPGLEKEFSEYILALGPAPQSSIEQRVDAFIARLYEKDIIRKRAADPRGEGFDEKKQKPLEFEQKDGRKKKAKDMVGVGAGASESGEDVLDNIKREEEQKKAQEAQPAADDEDGADEAKPKKPRQPKK